MALNARKVMVLVLALGLVMALSVTGCKREAAVGDYPARALELVVPYPPGGATDLTARALVSVLPEFLGQPVVVVNKAGAARLEGGEYVSSAAADGYTLGLFPPSVGWPEVHFNETPYTSEDLTIICRVVVHPTAIVVRSNSSIQTFDDLVARLATPGFQYGHTGVGANPHVTMTALAKALNAEVVPVPFKGDAGVAAALAGGHVELGVTTLPGILPQIQAGNVRVLAIYSPTAVTELEGVPTLGELGYDLEVPYADSMICGPKDLPAEVIAKVEEAVRQAVEHPSFKKIMGQMYTPVAYLNYADYAAEMVTTKEAMKQLMQELGLIN